MTDPKTLALMHAVLDGEASSTEQAALGRILEQDAALRDQFDRLSRVTALLAAVPELTPPADLLPAVMAKVSSPHRQQNFLDQLISEPDVIGSRASGFPAAATGKPKWVGQLFQLVLSFKETFMSEQKSGFFSGTKGRVAIGGGIAIAALVIVSSGIGFPDSGADTAGTIAPAQRYRSSQVPDANVKVGDSAETQSGRVNIAAGNAAANSAEKSADMAADRAASKSADKAADMAADRAANKAADKAADKAANRAQN